MKLKRQMENFFFLGPYSRPKRNMSNNIKNGSKLRSFFMATLTRKLVPETFGIDYLYNIQRRRKNLNEENIKIQINN